MKVKFTSDCEIEVHESAEQVLADEDGKTELFHVGDTIEFEVISHPGRMIDGEFKEDKDILDVQFGDGSVAFGLSVDWFDRIDLPAEMLDVSYTVIQEPANHTDKIVIVNGPGENVCIAQPTSMTIGYQQLFELGGLFQEIASRRSDSLDADSLNELIEGYFGSLETNETESENFLMKNLKSSTTWK